MTVQDPSVRDDAARFGLRSWSGVAGDDARRAARLDELVDVLTGFDVGDPALANPLLPLGGSFDPDRRDEGLDWPAHAVTMVGRRRLRNFRELIERAVADGVPGDVIEAGVWRGGASILARAVLASLGVTDRRVILADSFAGLPPPDPERFPADAGLDFSEVTALAVPLEVVRANFERFGLLDEQVTFLAGWFRDTMPRVPAERLAVVRLDGDMYESTMDPLVHLWDKLSPGGWVIVDDYAHKSCRAAVHDFLRDRAVDVELTPIDRIGVYFQKPA